LRVDVQLKTSEKIMPIRRCATIVLPNFVVEVIIDDHSPRKIGGLVGMKFFTFFSPNEVKRNPSAEK
jgi:hypothetical protein